MDSDVSQSLRHSQTTACASATEMPLVQSGSEKLEVALAEHPLKKPELLQAKSLIDFGTEGAEKAAARVADLEKTLSSMK